MHKLLIIEAFERAKKNETLKGIKNASKNSLSKVLSGFIYEEMGFSIGERSLKNYYDDALKKESDNADVNISQLNVVVGLCRYLGFEKYEDYIKENNKESRRGIDEVKEEYDDSSGSVVLFIKKYKSIVILGVLIIIVCVWYLINKPRWMVWQEDHYVEVAFDTDKYNLGQLKIYKLDRIEHFEKIPPDCETEYFKKDGDINLWYGKNSQGNLEFFTSLGLHPETGKTLKPITEYMIRKYLCEDY